LKSKGVLILKKKIKKRINKNSRKGVLKIQKNKPKLTIAVYLILRFLVILCLVAQSIHSNWNNVFLCLLTLVLFTLPDLVSDKFNITLPSGLEIIVYIFIFSSAILGEIQNFFGIFSHWDTMLHTLNGFLCAGVGFSLIDILNNDENLHISMTPEFVALVALCFSMTIGVCWEFFEFSADRYLGKDMQKDRIINKISSVKLNPEVKNEKIVINNINKTIIYSDNDQTITVIDGGYLDIGLTDTMKDLFVNFLGAMAFSIAGYLYIKNRDNYHIIENFLPRLKSKIE